jgi:hypothetical protein
VRDFGEIAIASRGQGGYRHKLGVGEGHAILPGTFWRSMALFTVGSTDSKNTHPDGAIIFLAKGREK